MVKEKVSTRSSKRSTHMTVFLGSAPAPTRSRSLFRISSTQVFVSRGLGGLRLGAGGFST